jgi:hypothetical protein
VIIGASDSYMSAIHPMEEKEEALTRVVDRFEGRTDIVYRNYTYSASSSPIEPSSRARNNTVGCSDSNYFAVSPVESPATGFYELDPENRFWEFD